jgi:hypothetical protein
MSDRVFLPTRKICSSSNFAFHSIFLFDRKLEKLSMRFYGLQAIIIYLIFLSTLFTLT